MECELCGSDAPSCYLVPKVFPDGPLESFLCRACGLKGNYLCVIHGDRPRMGFEDGSHACRICIEQEVADRQASADWLIQELAGTLPPDQFEDLMETGEVAGLASHTNQSISILRFVVTRRLRLGLTFDEVLDETRCAQSARSLLGLPPLPLFLP